MWKGDKADPETCRERARRMYPVQKGYERHHIDGNTANNSKENILIVTRKEHMKTDGRLELIRVEGHRWKKGECGNKQGARLSKKYVGYPRYNITCEQCQFCKMIETNFAICQNSEAKNKYKTMNCHQFKKFGYHGKNPNRKRFCKCYNPK